MTRLSCSPSSLVRAALLLTVVAISTRTADAGFQTSAGTVGAGVNLSGGPDAMTANFQAVQSSFADHALAQLSFDAPLGCATVITHACSAPPMAGVPACCAQGVSNIAQVTLGYTITSETLPIGTPVTVMVCAATARMTMASYAAPKSGPGFGDFSDAGLYISLNVGGAQFVGTAYQLAYDKSPPGKEVFTGLYGEPASEQSVMLIRQVGDSFGLNVTFVGSARSQAAVVGASADGRSSSSLLWGAAIVDAPAQIRSVDDNSLFPSALGCTAKAAVEASRRCPTWVPATPAATVLRGTAVERRRVTATGKDHAYLSPRIARKSTSRCVDAMGRPSGTPAMPPPRV